MEMRCESTRLLFACVKKKRSEHPSYLFDHLLLLSVELRFDLQFLLSYYSKILPLPFRWFVLRSPGWAPEDTVDNVRPSIPAFLKDEELVFD